MRHEEITNVERLSREDAKQPRRAIQIVAPEAVNKAIAAIDNSWDGWSEHDDPWTMTPHQIPRSKEIAKRLK